MSSLKAILSQFSKGSQLAFRQLYDLYSEDAYRLSYHILKSEKHAEEVVQDCFLKLWDNRDKIDIEGTVRTYLYVICRNLSFNKLKVLKREQKVFIPLEIEDLYEHHQTDDLLALSEFNESLENILTILPGRQRLIFRLSRVEGMSHKEIADQLNISTNTVKNHIVQALKTLRDHLDKNNQRSSLSLILFFFHFFS